jgi:hypothetical protein
MITGTFSPSDVKSAAWVHLRPRRSYFIVGVVLLAAFLWAGWVSFFGEGRPAGNWGRWVIPAVIAYFALIFGVWSPYQITRNFKQRKDLQREVSFGLSDSGIEMATTDFHGVKSWGDYLRWKEGKKVFLLYLSDNMYQVVPKRFFPSEAEISDFRALLKRMVPGGGV